ncbi:hypothetical protein D9611_000106 [Ephemerocybe angulata]|uniref:Amino acid permease/ SLC12A domain-containing protein n=1 Tax=Ephemerocybe angulata TaxID=980116 RepID=A0A8H5F6K4_9AGAR|nr:hypothetical protein D9611_000106 [Tulosesus angulatus]
MHEYSPLPTTATDNEIIDSGGSPDRGDGGTKRSLHERHLSMIALAGMIGTGLFLSSGKALAQAGPLGCVLGFLLMGSVTASIAFISAEMSAFKPVGGGFVRHATMWIDQSAGIVAGWNFWYSMAITMPAEVSAAVTLLGFWNPNQNVAIPILVLWLSITAINLAPVKFYGEFEFYFAFCKIAFIVAFIFSGMLLDAGILTGEGRIGFRYWSSPFPLFREYALQGWKGKIAGFWSTMIAAAFAYGNVQIVAIAGAETRNPRKAIPAALKKTFLRVVMFYVLSIFVMSLLVPASDPRLTYGERITQSPFVIAFTRAGIKGIPSAFNAAILTSAVSSANACTFLASRTLHGLALDGNAPHIFLSLNRYHIPYIAVLVSSAWGIVALLSLNSDAMQVFVWLVSVVTTAGLVSWIIICIAYLRFFNALQKQGISRDELPYKSPYQPFLTYFALVMNVLVVLTSGWLSFLDIFSVSSFLHNYLNCILVPLGYAVCKYARQETLVPLEGIDIKTELELIQHEAENENTKPITQDSTYDRILSSAF